MLSPRAPRRRFPVLALAPALALVLTAGAGARPIDLPPTPVRPSLAEAALLSGLPVPVGELPPRWSQCNDVKASHSGRARR